MALIDSLVSYYKFDENTTNTNVADSHGSNTGTSSANTSTLYNASGLLNSCFDLSNSTYIDLNMILAGGADWSVNFWFNPDAEQANYRIIDQWDFGVGGFRLMQRTSGVLRFEILNGGTEYQLDTAASTISTGGGWYMITLTFNNSTSTMEIHVNDVSKGTLGSVSMGTALTDCYISGMSDTTPGSTGADGQYDEIGLWTKVLSGQEIEDLYAVGSGLAYPFAAGGTTVSPSAVTLSMSEESPNYFIDITSGPVALTTSFNSPSILIPQFEYPDPVALTIGIPTPTLTVDSTSLAQGPGGRGTRFIRKGWPVEEGLEAATTRQKGRTMNLIATDSKVRSTDSFGIY